MMKHHCPWPVYHIEIPERLSCVLDILENEGFMEKMETFPAREATEAEISIVHSQRLIDDVKTTENMNVEQLEEFSQKYEDMYFNQNTWTCAKLAAGCSIDLVKKVLDTRESGFAAVRTPGHHAMVDKSCGFCVFNNVAIAAKHALEYGAKRVLVVDWDVHAGQGTQECIEDVEGVRLVSIHRFEDGVFWPNLPQSAVHSKFRNTVNVPLNGVGFEDGDYFAMMQLVVLPMITDFSPDLIIVSCGFDAALGDPEGHMKVTPAGYANMTRMLQNTGIPMAVILEGGYFLPSVETDALFVVRALLDEYVPPVEELSPMRKELTDVIRRIYKFYKDDYPTFSSLGSLCDKLSKFAFKDEKEYRGERNQKPPYATRSDHPKIDEEALKAAHQKILHLRGAYEKDLKKSSSYRKLKTRVQKDTSKLLSLDGEVVVVNEDVFPIVKLTLLSAVDPLYAAEGRRKYIQNGKLSEKTLEQLAADMEDFRRHELFTAAPVYQF
ncbi:unnamed protein product [Caenorhabditis auriculariae]|uniref:Histone deacetylase domain-containing protein n=1 Tax=Caenorhabditis auriculariae TaxID=2777116 RepID=A0A8S1HBV7_9PELO|nr:unnamed protein product [Caenorhabditis auriculariae]